MKFCMILILSISSATSLSFDCPNFEQCDTNSNSSLLKTEGVAAINNQFMIQLTKDNHSISVGQVTCRESFFLRDIASGKVADFTTSFEFIIDPKSSSTDDNNQAKGLLFFLAPDGYSLNVTSALEKGLLVSRTPERLVKLSTQHPFVAVEFDVFQSREPNVVKLSKGHQNNTTAKISYSSVSKNLSVSLFTTSENSGAHIQQVTSHFDYMVDLEQFLPDRVVVGFSAVTGTKALVLHKIISGNFTSTSLVDHELLVPSSQMKKDESFFVSVSVPGRFKAKSRKHMIIPLVSALFITSAIAWFIINNLLGLGVLNSCKHKIIGPRGEPLATPDLTDVQRQNKTGHRHSLRSYFGWEKGKSSGDDQNHSMITDRGFEKGIGPRKFSYRELDRATSNFKEANKVGEGGFGPVYRGFIKDLNPNIVAVKKSKESRQGMDEYVAEIKMTSELRHRNLVKLIGWCNEMDKLLLVYEFMFNGSLETHLFEDAKLLSWEKRYNIAQSLAFVIHYLQEGWDRCVIHRDIKTSNILLDLNFNMKLADFGLARAMDHGESSVTTDAVVGTAGYMAPEYLSRGEFSKKSDVFSFGVVSLEIACGRRQRDETFRQTSMAEWIWRLYREGKVLEAADSKLRGVFDEKQMECLLIVGLWCAHPDYNMRPPIAKAILVLNFNAPLPTLPSEMPESPPEFPSGRCQSTGQNDTRLQPSISGR